MSDIIKILIAFAVGVVMTSIVAYAVFDDVAKAYCIQQVSEKTTTGVSLLMEYFSK